MRLTSKQASLYLPYNARMKNTTTEMPLTGWYIDELSDPQFGFDDSYKLILRPFDSLTQDEIEDICSLDDDLAYDNELKCFYNISLDINYDEGLTTLPYWLFDHFLSMHIDMDDLIGKGVAMDKNN